MGRQGTALDVDGQTSKGAHRRMRVKWQMRWICGSKEKMYPVGNIRHIICFTWYLSTMKKK